MSRLIFAGKLTDLPPQAVTSVWLPVPISDDDQIVQRTAVTLPSSFEEQFERVHANGMMYFQAPADAQGEIPIRVEYELRRRAIESATLPPAARADDQRYLQSTTQVPFEDPQIVALMPTAPSGDPRTQGLAIADRVLEKIKWDATAMSPATAGNAAAVCASGQGDSAGMHSVFLALLGHYGIPGRFEVGLRIPSGTGLQPIGDYHCWARFTADGKWIPVDLAQASVDPANKAQVWGALPADRILLSIGRDLQLNPPQQGAPLNMLIHAYAEVAGEPAGKFVAAWQIERLSD